MKFGNVSLNENVVWKLNGQKKLELKRALQKNTNKNKIDKNLKLRLEPLGVNC